MNITDTIKHKVDELELERHLNDAAEVAEKAIRSALERAGEYAHEHGKDIGELLDKAESAIDRAGSAIDARTDGRFATTVAKVKEQVQHGVAKVAAQRPADDED
jgi:HEPN domain-containing protein